MADGVTQLIAAGKEMGLTGTALQEWVKEIEAKEKEREDRERDERAKEREVRAKETEARTKEAEAKAKEKEADVEIHKLRIRELELRETKGEIKEQMKPVWKPKLPPFNENVDLMDAYLARFEVHAQATDIPKTQWGSHLYTLLQGKALQACINFSKKDLEEYDKVKEVLMKRYNLTDDGYREKFHKAKPERNQPFQEFVEDITRYLMRWVELSNTEKTFEGLMDLFIRYKILTSCNPQLVAFLHERKPKELPTAVKLCQQYITAHPEQTIQREEDLITSKFAFAAKTNDNKTGFRQEWKQNLPQKRSVGERRKCFK